MAEILVEFIPDYSKLEAATDELVSSGVISKEFGEMFKQAQKPVDDLAKKTKSTSTSMNRDLASVKKSVEGITKSFATGFKQGVEETLKEAGVSVKQFEDALKKTDSTGQSLKARLKEIVQEMAQLKAEGKDNTAQYEQLVQEAGKYRDALGDVSAEIKRVASDTQKIDTAIEIFQGLAASYQLAMGALSLLGEDTEQYQAALVKLNAVMAISMSLQQIGNLLQKESNVVRAVSNFQTKLSVTVTNLETAAQSKNVIVKGLATAAMRVLNTVMKANPVFLLIGAFTALAGALAFFTGNTNKSKDAVERYDAALKALDSTLQGMRDVISDTSTIDIKNLELRGAKSSEITKRRIQDLKAEKDALTKSIDDTVKLQSEVFADDDLKHKDRKAKMEELYARESQLLYDRSRLNARISAEEIQVKIDQQNESREAAEKGIQDAKRREEEEKKIRAQGFEDFKALQEIKLLAVEKGSLEELDLKKRLLNVELQQALDNSELTENQRLLLIRKFFIERKKLDEDYYQNSVRIATENQISLLNAELSAMNVSARAREDMTIGLLNRQRELELDQVKNNKEKEKEINAKYDKEISEQRLAIRQSALDKELALAAAQNGQLQRVFSTLADDVLADLDARKGAVDALTQIEIDAIQKRRAVLEAANKDGLLSQIDYNLQSAQLKDAELVVYENAEKKKTAIVKAEKEQRLASFKEEAGEIIAVATGIIGALSSIVSTITEIENQKISDMRANLENMRDMNMLTQKEFEQRNKQIDAADRANKRKQAAREKEIALFNAFVQGAQAIVEAAPNPFMIAFTAALVGAQIASIIARPIPKFGTGTKSAPRGFAEVGETGTEIVKTDKGYYLADHPQVIWMKGGERIYNPRETETIMKSSVPAADHSIIAGSSSHGGSSGIDYQRMAKAVGSEIAKHPRNVINLDEDGFSHHLLDRNNKTKYLNKRYTFHD